SGGMGMTLAGAAWTLAAVWGIRKAHSLSRFWCEKSRCKIREEPSPQRPCVSAGTLRVRRR
ncbi:hypothetical protein, partial [Salmonella enterica]|uniref:hypothetical protein n=1 Tax=Salmonella enterica TaxID=28901 RepID=UPI0032968EF1